MTVKAVSATNNSPSLRLMFSQLIFSIIHYLAFMRAQLLPLFVPACRCSVFQVQLRGSTLAGDPQTYKQRGRNCTHGRVKGYKGWKSLFKLLIVF